MIAPTSNAAAPTNVSATAEQSDAGPPGKLLRFPDTTATGLSRIRRSNWHHAILAPPLGLSPAAATAFTQTRAIQALDLVRDAAISANEQTAVGCVPAEEIECASLLSTATTRRIVQYHKSAITLVHEAPAGWRSSVLAGLDEALANLPPAERRYVEPYSALIRAILQEAAEAEAEALSLLEFGQSRQVFSAIWDNPDDAEYNKL